LLAEYLKYFYFAASTDSEKELDEAHTMGTSIHTHWSDF
jgi:hypothetical protein